MGVPHRGLEIAALKDMVRGTPSELIVSELKAESPTLLELKSKFNHVVDDTPVLTLYEMHPSHTVINVSRDNFKKFQQNLKSRLMFAKPIPGNSVVIRFQSKTVCFLLFRARQLSVRLNGIVLTTLLQMTQGYVTDVVHSLTVSGNAKARQLSWFHVTALSPTQEMSRLSRAKLIIHGSQS
jgi:hypothetical protein